MPLTRALSDPAGSPINKSTSPPTHPLPKPNQNIETQQNTLSLTRSYGNGGNGSSQSLLLRQEPYSTIRQSHGTFLSFEIRLREIVFFFSIFIFIYTRHIVNVDIDFGSQSSLPSEAVQEKEKARATVSHFFLNKTHFGCLIFFKKFIQKLYLIWFCLFFILWNEFRAKKFLLQWIKQLNVPLEAMDPEIADIIELEKARQWKVHTYIHHIELLFFFKFILSDKITLDFNL